MLIGKNNQGWDETIDKLCALAVQQTYNVLFSELILHSHQRNYFNLIRSDFPNLSIAHFSH